jgi:hypothetical protein
MTKGIKYSDVTKFIHNLITTHSEKNKLRYEKSMFEVFDKLAQDIECHWEPEGDDVNLVREHIELNVKDWLD